jgi:hypothetical protein
MRLKRYFDFIKESVEEKSMWRHSDEDFKWYLTDFTDNGYTIDIHKMFVNDYSENVGSWSRPHYKTREILSDVLIDDSRECYVIQITETPDAPGGDLSDSLYFVKGVVESELNMKCEIMLNDTSTSSFDWKEYRAVDGEDVKVDSGKITRQLSTRDEDVEEFTDVCIVCWYEEDIIIFTGEQFLDYYGWDKDMTSVDGKPGLKISEKGDVWVRIDQDDLSGIIDWRSSREVSEDSLLHGVEIWHSDYLIDTDSLVRYHLNKDALLALTKFLISEAGGLEEFVNNVETDLDLEGLKEDEVISAIVDERFETTLVKAAEAFGGDTFDDIRRDWQSWSDQSQADQYDDAIQSEFDNKLGDLFTFEKEKYRTEFKVGSKWYNLFFYWILIEDKMLNELYTDHNYELGDLKGIGPKSLPMEWFGRCGESSSIYVRDQYGDVDTDAFSKDIISQYLS